MTIMFKKRFPKIGFALFISGIFYVPFSYAEILVLLPERGVFAPAGASVKEGLTAAYYAGTRRPPLRFVDSSDQPMDILLAKEIKSDTELVIGPLSREQVGELVNIPVNIPVLTLNEVAQSQKNVWQFALAPDEDANTLAKAMLSDGVTQLYVVTQPQFTKGDRFRSALANATNQTTNQTTSQTTNQTTNQTTKQATKFKLEDVKDIPASLTRTQGLLVLGSSAWVGEQKLPHDRVYAPSFVFDRRIPLSTGLQFCDTPALLRGDWAELNALNTKQPASTEIQRLRAFGADSWQIAQLLLDHAASAKFAGRTGEITLSHSDIKRVPVCFRATNDGLIPR
jgi:outer membrane PBP1 activator LpoA protein